MLTEKRERKQVQVLVIILLVAALLRLIDIGAFPEITPDEGLWTNSSKNFLFFHDWFMDDRTHMLLSPVFHALTLPVFMVFGPSIEAARILSASASLVSVLLLYFLVRRLTRSETAALLVTALFAFDQANVVLNRMALIESTQLVWLLASALALLRGGRMAPPLGALFFALALLTKINAIFMGAVLPLFLVNWDEEKPQNRQFAIQSLVFLGTSAVIVGAVYGALYLAYPARFMSAFVFELDGQHFESLSRPLIRLGRFGLDPTQAGRTVLELFQESPFLMVLATIGCAVSWVTRPRGFAVFGVWIGVGVAFVLGQMFQPLRYFYLAAPAFAFFAAQPLLAMRLNASAAQVRGASVAMVVVLMFSVAHVGMNWLANRGEKLAVVNDWAAKNLGPADNVLAAGYFCTDLRVRAYAYYHLARNPTELAQTIDRLKIKYVIADADEWPEHLRTYLAQNYPVAARWHFGNVYRVERRSDSAVNGATIN